jgi:hypothetical protein
VIFGPLKTPAMNGAETAHSAETAHGAEGAHGAETAHGAAGDTAALPGGLSGRGGGGLLPVGGVGGLLGVLPTPMMNTMTDTLERIATVQKRQVRDSGIIVNYHHDDPIVLPSSGK